MATSKVNSSTSFRAWGVYNIYDIATTNSIATVHKRDAPPSPFLLDQEKDLIIIQEIYEAPTLWLKVLNNTD